MNAETIQADPSTEDISKAVMLVRPTLASVTEVGGLLLKATKSAEPRVYGDEVASYLATLDNLVLNWMAEGKHKELRDLAAAVGQCLSDFSAKPDLLGTLPAHDQLTVRLDVLTGQVVRLLVGDSMAKHMGIVTGKRREKWRELLLNLYEHDGPPIRKNQLDEFAPAGMKHDALMKAVDSMTGLGLLAKHRSGPKNVQVELTWAGRRVAQAWLATEKKMDARRSGKPAAETTQDVAMLKSERMLVVGDLPGDMRPFDEEIADGINHSGKAA